MAGMPSRAPGMRGPRPQAPAADAVALLRNASRRSQAHLAQAQHQHGDAVGAALRPRLPQALALRPCIVEDSRGAAPAWPTARSRPSTAFIAGSTMRAIGTPGGSVGSSSSRSTPAHSDWIRRSFGMPRRLPGGGLATTATCTVSATAKACVAVQPAGTWQRRAQGLPPIVKFRRFEFTTEQDVHATSERLACSPKDPIAC